MIYRAPCDLFTAHRSSGLVNTAHHEYPNSYFHLWWAFEWCVFISCWIRRVLHWCACLLFLPLSPSLCLPLSLSITMLDFLSQSLCLFLPLWQTGITCQSLIFHFPLPFSAHLLSIFVFFFFICPHSRLSSSPTLCLYFVWLTSVITRLPLVFCFVYVVSFGLLFCASQGKNPYTCQRAVEATLQRLFGPSGETAILLIHLVHTPTQACLP